MGGSDLNGTGNELANILSGNVGANTLQGLSGKDTIYGGDGRDDLVGGKGRDHLLGGRGGDDLQGGKGKDLLRGNGGADDFVFTHLGDSGTSNNTRDRIEGFGGGDQIVLRDIDAVRGGGDQAFRLDTDGSFEAGEIRLREVNAGLRVELNVDSDHKAEMTIMLANVHGGLNDSDFVFCSSSTGSGWRTTFLRITCYAGSTGYSTSTACAESLPPSTALSAALRSTPSLTIRMLLIGYLRGSAPSGGWLRRST